MANLNRDTTISWLGHGTFHIVTPTGKKLLLDAWVDSNPACPTEWKDRIRNEGLDAIFVTHGHSDHINELLELATVTNAKILGIFDLTTWLGMQGVDESRLIGFNKGGTVEVAGIKATMTVAQHSSTYVEDGKLIPLGDPVGYVLTLENGFTIYFTGDTAVTYDMKIVGELYHPELTILPIGDWYTMDPRQAAYALRLIGSKYAIPGHFGTFPALTGTPEALRQQCEAQAVTVEVLDLAPGESIS